MDPKVLTFEEVTGLLESGDFDSFIKVRESANFEAKTKRPYRFDGARTKRSIMELCKDTAAAANSGEPCHIIFGLITSHKSKSTSRCDKVIRKQLFTKRDFYKPEQIINFLKLHILPNIQVNMKWYPYKRDRTRGLGVITIQKQETNNYFVIRILESGGSKLKGKYYGIPIRTDAEIEWVDIERYRKPFNLTPEDIEKVHISLSNQLEELRQLIKPKKPSVMRSEDSLKKKVKEALNG